MDTRTLSPGNLFFALKGPRFDGHEFVGAAFDKGASGAVVARGWAEGLDRGPLLIVDDPVAALREAALRYREEVNPEIIGVTGSAGKTTVKEMIADLLSAAGPVVRSRGNWNNDIGIPLSMLAMERCDRFGVFEAGVNHPGEMAALCRILKPTWGVITNVGPVHLEFFASVEEVAREKAEMLRAVGEKGIAVLSNDCRLFDLLRSAAPRRVLTVSLEGNADYVCAERRDTDGGMVARVEERATGEQVTLEIPVPGDHNVHNALLALAVARGHGVGWEAIVTAMKAYSPLPMRWERRDIGGVVAVNDAYNANPMSMRAAVATFRRMKSAGRKWLMLGGMLEMGEASDPEHLALGRELAAGDWGGMITVGDLGARIADGAEEAGFDPIRVFRCRDNAEAGETLARCTASGDAVLLKGSRGIHLEDALACWTRIRENTAVRRARDGGARLVS